MDRRARAQIWGRSARWQRYLRTKRWFRKQPLRGGVDRSIVLGKIREDPPEILTDPDGTPVPDLWAVASGEGFDDPSDVAYRESIRAMRAVEYSRRRSDAAARPKKEYPR